MHEHEARLERLEAARVDAPRQGRGLRLPTSALAGSGPARSGDVALQARGLVVGYLPGRGAVDASGAPAAEPREIARAPALAARRGERIGIVGPNGAGKTTLLRTLAGDLPTLDGAITMGNGVQVGYLAQLREAGMPGATVLDALLSAYPTTPGEARGYLARFLFRGDDVLKEVRLLSGGERSRLEMAVLGVMPSNLLLLDEPTNHLDIPAREAIEAFLTESPATLLVVSHDRRLLETVCQRLWVVEGRLAVSFDGGYRAWRAAVADGWTVAEAADREARRVPEPASGASGRTGPVRGVAAAQASGGSLTGLAGATRASAASSGRGITPGGGDLPAPRSTAAVRRPRLSKDAYRRQKAAIEAELTRLGLRRSHLELALGDPRVQANFVELRRMTSELADVATALTSAEESWLELAERAP
jgi:ATP-binding cassette subfamily F protein 3